MGRYVKNSRIQNADQYAVKVPSGGTTLRPIEAVDGQFRFNTTTNETEVYYNNQWNTFTMQGDVTVVKDTFTGDGSTVSFTPMTYSYASGEETLVLVFIENVHQNPTVAYTFNSTKRITFTSAPPNGSTIIVLHRFASNDYTSNPYVGPPFSPEDVVDLEGWWQFGSGYNIGDTSIPSQVTQWDDVSGYGRHLVSPTQSRYPWYLPYNGEKYFKVGDFSIQGSSNYIQTNAPAGLSGDIEIITDIAPSDWTPGAVVGYFNKSAGAVLDIRGLIFTGGNLYIDWWQADATQRTATSTVAISATDYSRLKIRVTIDVDNGAGGCDVNFYTSTNGGISWTPLGSTVTQGFTTDIRESVGAVINFGSLYGGSNTINGKVYSGQVYNGIGGTLVADLDIDRDANDNDLSFVSSTTGETWIIQGNGPYIVGSTSLEFDGTSDSMQTNSFALSQPWTFYMRAAIPSFQAPRIPVTFNSGTNQFIQTGAPNLLSLSAGAGPVTGGNVIAGQTQTFVFVFDGANSIVEIDGNVTSGSAGTGSFDLLTIATSGTFTLPTTLAVKELILYSGAHDANTRANITSYLGNIA